MKTELGPWDVLMAGARLWAVLLGVLVPGAAAAQQAAPTGIASVTYLGRDWLFIDAGSAEGLQQGSEAEIVRRGRTVAVLRVESLGDHQANCAVLSRELPVMVGDSVRFTPVAPPSRAAAVVAARPADSAVAATTAHPAAVSPPRDSTPARQSVNPAPVAAAAQPAAQTPPRRDSTAKAPAPQPARDAGARRGAAVTTSTVTFLSGAEIYVGVGRQEGLIEGAELSVVRRDSVVSTLRVKFLSSHQSSCEVIRGANDIKVGDVVRFSPRAPAAGTGATATAARPHRPRRLSGPGIHGRLGMRYLRATSAATGDSSGAAAGSTGFNQPSFDLRLNGLSIGGTPIGLSVDLRTRRTVSSSTGQPNRVDGKTRVYQAAIFWAGRAPDAGPSSGASIWLRSRRSACSTGGSSS